MPVTTPTRYVRLHILIDRDEENDQHYVRILPPAPALDSFRDAMYRLELGGPPPDHVAKLVENIEEALAEGADLTERGSTFRQIRRCGEWIDERLRGAALDFQLCLRDSLNVHNKSRDLGVLILLHFGENAAELSRLLWETWFCKIEAASAFLIKRNWVSLARFVPAQAPPRGEETDGARPLKLLVTTSSFQLDGSPDPKLPDYLQDDRLSLEKSLADLIRIGVFAEPIYLPDPTVEELSEALRDADILHHFGHGAFDEQAEMAFMMLRDPITGGGRQVFWHELQDCFWPDTSPRLKLVVLNACELQRAGLGTELARFGVPAVITMQAEIDARVIADSGFTHVFYTRIAAGDPVHAAFSKARASIFLQYNCVEAFVPVLILSTLEELKFHHSQTEKARQVAEQHELLQDPWKPAWEEAALLEERGEVAAALERFRDLFSRQADYPGVQERIEILQGRVAQQKRVRELVEQLERAAHEGDLRRLQDLLRDTEPLAREPVLAAALERQVHQLSQRLEDLRQEGQKESWLEARELLRILQAMAVQLPEERRPVLPAEAIETAARREVAKLRQILATMARKKQWIDLVARAQEYLSLEPTDGEVLGWLGEGQEFARLVDDIKIDPQPSSSVSASLSEIKELFESGDWEQVTKLGEELLDQLPPALRSDLDRLMLTAAAQQNREDEDWSTVKEISRQMLRLNPGDSEAQAMLRDSLRHEAQMFAASRRWEEAEADCRELLRIAPQQEQRDAWDLLGATLLGQAEDAKRRHDWSRALEVSQRILSERNLRSKYEDAERLRKEADEALRLLRRIRVL